jgi:hypothetical protein
VLTCRKFLHFLLYLLASDLRVSAILLYMSGIVFTCTQMSPLRSMLSRIWFHAYHTGFLPSVPEFDTWSLRMQLLMVIVMVGSVLCFHTTSRRGGGTHSCKRRAALPVYFAPVKDFLMWLRPLLQTLEVLGSDSDPEAVCHDRVFRGFPQSAQHPMLI